MDLIDQTSCSLDKNQICDKSSKRPRDLDVSIGIGRSAGRRCFRCAAGLNVVPELR